MRLRELALCGAAMACALVVLWPAPTCAEEISDDERRPDYGEEGPEFDGIAVKAELAADAKVPGGWVLVRTIVNTKDAPATCTVEERIMREESQLDARAGGTPLVESATTRTFSLKPHETKKLGVALPPSLGAAITAGQRAREESERARERAWNGGPDDVALRALVDRTYLSYFVEYLKPLPPGATAKKPEVITHPARMTAGVAVPRDGDLDPEGARFVARGGTK